MVVTLGRLGPDLVWPSLIRTAPFLLRRLRYSAIKPPLAAVSAPHVKRLLWRRAAAPNRVKRWGLVADLGPALAGAVADFGAPVGKGLVLPPGNVLLKCSCQVTCFLI
jgi:hypothetical protein